MSTTKTKKRMKRDKKNDNSFGSLEQKFSVCTKKKHSSTDWYKFQAKTILTNQEKHDDR